MAKHEYAFVAKYDVHISVRAESEDEAKKLLPNDLELHHHPCVGVIVDSAEIDDCEPSLMAVDGEEVE